MKEPPTYTAGFRKCRPSSDPKGDPTDLIFHQISTRNLGSHVYPKILKQIPRFNPSDHQSCDRKGLSKDINSTIGNSSIEIQQG